MVDVVLCLIYSFDKGNILKYLFFLKCHYIISKCCLDIFNVVRSFALLFHSLFMYLVFKRIEAHIHAGMSSFSFDQLKKIYTHKQRYMLITILEVSRFVLRIYLVANLCDILLFSSRLFIPETKNWCSGMC